MSKKNLTVVGALLAVFMTSGCQGMSNTAKGGLIGGGTGAALGGIAGGGKGALVGGLIGTGIGGLIGNDIDNEEKKEKDLRLAVAEAKASNNTLPPPAPSSATPLGMADVIQMSRDGMSDNMIINQIRTTNSTFLLSVEDLRMLQANNVSQRVIEEMQMRRPVTRVIREQPRYIYQQPQPVYIYDPYPPPRPQPFTTVGVGVYSRVR